MAACKDNSDSAPAVLYFVPNSLETKALARAKAMSDAGIELIVVGFRRPGYPAPDPGTWQYVDLGELSDGNYLARIGTLLRAAYRIIPVARRLKKHPRAVVIARNLDLALLARACTMLAGLRAPFVYEVLDIRKVMMGSGIAARALRWAERRILNSTARLWISAPKFAEEYFLKIQGFGGQWRLLENKIVHTADPRPDQLPEKRWVIGWFGALRCPKSLDMLCRLASDLPDTLDVYVRGFPTTIDEEYFHQSINSHDNIYYDGAYSHQDLPEMMAKIHFSWSFDYIDAWGNSAWLLPNRVYEAGYYERPLLGDATHATGTRIREEGLGWTFSGDIVRGIEDLLMEMNFDQWTQKRDDIASKDKSLFYEPGEIVSLINEVSG